MSSKFQASFYMERIGPLIRRTIARRGGIAMAFFNRELFKRELGPIERFENALKEKLAARQKLAERLSVAEAELAEKRAAAERLAVAGAANARPLCGSLPSPGSSSSPRGTRRKAHSHRHPVPHVGEEPIVLEDLLADFLQLFPQRGPPSIELPESVAEPLSALPPLLLFIQS